MNRLFPAIKKKLQSLTLYNHHFNYYNFRTHTSPIIGLKQEVWCPQRDKWQWVLSHMLAIIITIWSDAVLRFHIFSIGVLNVNFSEGPPEAWRIISGSLCRSVSSTPCSPAGTRGLKTSTSSGHRGGHSHEQHPWAAAALQGEQDAPREGAQHQQLYQLPKAKCARWVLRGQTTQAGQWHGGPVPSLQQGMTSCSIFTRLRQHDVWPLSNQRSVSPVSNSSSCLRPCVGNTVWLEAQGQARNYTSVLYPPGVYPETALTALFRAA